jgi:hypothetical protein
MPAQCRIAKDFIGGEEKKVRTGDFGLLAPRPRFYKPNSYSTVIGAWSENRSCR